MLHGDPMKLDKTLSALLLAFVATSALADEPATDERDRVYDFLKANVIGKSLGFANVSQNSDKTLEYDFKRTMRYRNLVKTERGLAFDVFVIIQQTNYDVTDGKRTPGKAGVKKD